jgi:hypothetical protein
VGVSCRVVSVSVAFAVEVVPVDDGVKADQFLHRLVSLFGGLLVVVVVGVVGGGVRGEQAVCRLVVAERAER